MEINCAHCGKDIARVYYLITSNHKYKGLRLCAECYWPRRYVTAKRLLVKDLKDAKKGG